MNLSTPTALFLLLLVAAVPGCTSDEPFPSLDVTVTGTRLPMLGPFEGQYVLWFSYPDDPTSEKANVVAHSSGTYVPVGAFVVDQSGKLTTVEGGELNFTLPDGYNPQLISDAIVTIELPGAIPEEPSARLLAGPMRGSASEGRADLTVGGADAFDDAFADAGALAAANFALLTPSTDAINDEEYGIWFLSGTSAEGLPLATLPISRDNPDWVYAAWVVDNPGVRRVSIGTFTNPDSSDSDAAGPWSGPKPNPLQLPGSDFVQGTVLQLNSGDYGLVVSLQPEGFPNDRPFYEIFRLDTIPAGVETGIPIRIPYVRTEPIVSVSFSR